MLSTLSRIFFFTALLMALLPPRTEAAGHSLNIVPSAYFVLPGQSLTINASGFPQNETLRIAASGSEVVLLRPGASSSFTFTVPFRADSVTISASGEARRIAVGKFYPVVKPSSYFVQRGGQLSFSGQGFAAREQVSISRGSAEIGRVFAAEDGKISAGPFVLPQAGGDYTFAFKGILSGASYSARVHVADYDPWIVLSNYYATQGAFIEARGSAFGARESVEVMFGNIKAGVAKADDEGNFSLYFTIPGGGQGEKIIQARGLSSGLSAKTRFTQAN